MKLIRILTRTVLSIGVVLLLVWIGFAFVKPSNDRVWKEDHARVPLAHFDGDRVTVENVRNSAYVSADSANVVYETRTYDLNQINGLWYVLSIFHEDDDRGPAHGMLSFGFGDDQYVVISVEARKEVGESYSAGAGLFKKYELIYVVGDERDLILTRAVHKPDDVYLFPVTTTPQKIRELFVDMLESANQLAEKPAFYNTLTRNCTSQLRTHVNAVSPGRIGPTWRTVLPGYSDELLVRLGLVNTEEDLEATRRRFWINDHATKYVDDPDFSGLLRAALTAAP